MSKENIKDIEFIIKNAINLSKNTDIFEMKMYEKGLSNKNNMSYWYPKIVNCGIKTPETFILNLSYGQFKWFLSDNYLEKDIEQMSQYIKDILIKNNFDINRNLFIKTGNFSNKFDFSTCKVTDISNIGKQFLDIYYTAMVVGAGYSTELVIRDFIKSDKDKKRIYNGMPLNTEFRVFYNFDNNESIDVFNYWDTKVIKDNLLKKSKYDEGAKYDYDTFNNVSNDIEAEFERLKLEALNLVSEKMQKIDLTGIWSIDLMYANDEFYLIDMALAHQSYYYELIKDKIK